MLARTARTVAGGRADCDAHGRVAGFAARPRRRLAAQIGPLTADDDDIARALAARALDESRARFTSISPTPRAELRSWLDGSGFAAQRPFTRMLLRPHDALRRRRAHAVAGPEFG